MTDDKCDISSFIEGLNEPEQPDFEKKALPTILQTETAPSALFKVEKLQLQFRNGEQRQYERIKGSVVGAVIVVAMLDDKNFILIREYACGLHRYELGLPKGRLEPGEDVLAGANRELMEETGFGAHDLQEVNILSLAPGYMAHCTHIVIAKNLYVKKLPGDEPEPIDVYRWSLANLHELAQRSDCTEGRTLAALYLIRDLLRSA